MSERFRGRVAIVTGAGQGIGRQTAIDLAAEGGSVALLDVARDELEATARELREMGGECLVLDRDVSIRAEVDSAVRETVRSYGTVDILVNNAGLLLTGSIEETTDEIIDETINVNLKGVMYAIQAVAPIMKAKHYGKIVNVASITGKNGDNSTVFVYGATKGAVISLTRSVARQLGPFNINVNAVAPHAVMTGMMGYWDDEKKRTVSDKIPLRRLGTPEDIASLMLFLSSDDSSFITGETININGGYYMD